MQKALKQLIDTLDKVFEEHEEIGGTDVREQMYDTVHKTHLMSISGMQRNRDKQPTGRWSI